MGGILFNTVFFLTGNGGFFRMISKDFSFFLMKSSIYYLDFENSFLVIIVNNKKVSTKVLLKYRKFTVLKKKSTFV